MRLRGQNPVYKYDNYDAGYSDVDSATYGGVVTKSTILLGIVAIIAMYFGFTLDFSNGIEMVTIITVIAAPIIAIIAVIMTHKYPDMALITTMVYSVCEGIFLGFISAIFAAVYGGEIIQMALMGTFGVLGGMLLLYSTGIIRVGAYFRRAMFSMLVGLIFASLLLLVIRLTGFMGGAFDSLYILIVLVSVVVSSLYLLIDFDNISKYVDAGAPKNREWSLALGLVVTLVWLYFEMLRLIAIVTNRRR